MTSDRERNGYREGNCRKRRACLAAEIARESAKGGATGGKDGDFKLRLPDDNMAF